MKNAEGRSYGSPIYREHWKKHEVVGETRVSWILRFGDKVPKKGANPRRVCFSEKELDDNCFLHAHASKIGELVARIEDAETLRKIAAMVGYTPEPEKNSTAP